jgi:hypothetical protein
VGGQAVPVQQMQAAVILTLPSARDAFDTVIALDLAAP